MAPTLVIVGTGRMARIRARAAQDAAPDLAVQIAGRDPDRVGVLAEELGATPADLGHLEHDEVVGAIITSTTANHLADLTAVLPIGCPVLCEKPLGERSDDAATLVEAARSAGTPLYVGFQRRFDAGYAAIKARVADGTVGDLVVIRTTSFDHRPSAPEFLAASGGIFLDLLVHDIDTVLWLGGSPVSSVYAAADVRTHAFIRDLDDFDVATVVLRLENGVTATIDATRSNPLGQDVRCEVLGTRDSVAAGLGERAPLHRLDSTAESGEFPDTFMDRFADAFQRETAEFVAYLQGRSEFSGCTAQECLDAMVVAERCEESARAQNVLAVQPT